MTDYPFVYWFKSLQPHTANNVQARTNDFSCGTFPSRYLQPKLI